MAKRHQGAMGGRRSRGSGKKLHWASIKQAVANGLEDWEGSPFFTLDGFIDYIHKDYWRLARSSGHYRARGTFCIRRRLRSQVSIMLKQHGVVRKQYGRIQPRRDRFGYLIENTHGYWTLPGHELPKSEIHNTSRLWNLRQMWGEEE